VNRRTIEETAVFFGLLSVGVLLREITREEQPGVFPLLALPIFAGFYFRRAAVAAVLPLMVLAITDFWAGAYVISVQATVYIMSALTVATRYWIGDRSAGHAEGTSLRHWGAISGSTVVSAVAYYLVTNFPVYLAWYERSWAGLTECYVLALPFLGRMIVSNFTAAVVLFGAYHLAHAMLRGQSKVPKLAE
jgi:hypothetical protein